MSYYNIELVKIESTGVLGTAVRFTIVLNTALGDSDTIKITIEDSVDTTKIDDVAMTKDADGVYSYIFQSDVNDGEGVYAVIFQIVSGDTTIVREKTFEMIDSELLD